MPELLGRRGEAKEGLQGQEFIPEGVDVLNTPQGPLTIIRGKTVDGQAMAAILPVGRKLHFPSSGPRTAPTSKSPRPGVSKFSRLAMAAAGALAIAGCNVSDHSDEEDKKPQSSYGVMTGALTKSQMASVGGKPLPDPLSQWGDFPGNFAEMDGKRYLFIGNTLIGSNWNNVSYIECDKLKDCFNASAKRQTVEGLKEAGLTGTFYGAGIYKEQTGKYKFLVKPSSGPALPWTYSGDIAKNPTSGKLIVSNMKLVDPTMGDGPSIVQEKGVPHALYGSDQFGFDRNLYDGTEKALPNSPSGDYDCGAPTLDGELAVGSKMKTVQGATWCQLVMADSLDNLAAKSSLISTLNLTAPGKKLMHPRLATDTDGSGILIYSVLEQQGTRIWYALIPAPKPPVDADASDGDVTGETSGEVDAGSLPEAGVDSATDIAAEEAATVETAIETAAEIAQEVAEAVDALDALDATDEADLPADIQPTPDVQSAPDTATPDTDKPDATPTPDTATPDTQVTPDTNKPDITTTPDTQPNPDTTPACTSEFPGFAITAGNCTIKACPVVEGGKNGSLIDITGSGANKAICKATGTSNGKPVSLTMSNDEGGKIKVSYKFFENTALEMYPADGTTQELQEQGAGAQGKAYGITMSSSASHFYFTPRGLVNGEQTVEIMNAAGEPVLNVTSKDFKEFQIMGDGKWYKVETKTGAATQKFPDTPKAETQTTTTNPPKPTPKPKPKDPGCTAAPGNMDTQTWELVSMGLAGLAMLSRRRKSPAVQRIKMAA